MVDFTYDYSFLLKMIRTVFLPLLLITFIIGFVIFIYSRKVKKKDIERYNFIVDFFTNLLAIIIVGSLFAVTLGFSFSLIDTINTYDLKKGHEVIYYLVFLAPVLPFSFLFVYLYKMILLIINIPKNKKRKTDIDENLSPEMNNNFNSNNSVINDDLNNDKDNSEFIEIL